MFQFLFYFLFPKSALQILRRRPSCGGEGGFFKRRAVRPLSSEGAAVETVLDDTHARIWLLISPLIKKSEKEIKRLDRAIIQTESFCQNIREKYRLRWE